MSVVGKITPEAVTFDDVAAAVERIKPLAHNTVVQTSRLFDERTGVKAYFKCENLQRGGAFKIRGAMNFLKSLSEGERRRGAVTFSSGNHAQAVAMAAAHLGIAATIVMPTDTPKAKLESTMAYEPEIIFFDRQRENREEIAKRIAKDIGAVVLPSYDHPWIIAGQGTAALELIRNQPDLDAIAVPLGGGGLLSGTLVAAKTLRPDIRVFGVEPELANDWYLSLERGQRVEIAPPPTIADGLRTSIPGAVTFPIVQAMAEGVVLVSEEEIKATMRFLLSRMKMLTEPSGAVAAAAVLHKKLPGDIHSVGVILSGGNVDLDALSEICRETA
jgi:threonine dehydratase